MTCNLSLFPNILAFPFVYVSTKPNVNNISQTFFLRLLHGTVYQCGLWFLFNVGHSVQCYPNLRFNFEHQHFTEIHILK